MTARSRLMIALASAQVMDMELYREIANAGVAAEVTSRLSRMKFFIRVILPEVVIIQYIYAETAIAVSIFVTKRKCDRGGRLRDEPR